VQATGVGIRDGFHRGVTAALSILSAAVRRDAPFDALVDASGVSQAGGRSRKQRG
jgi:hypothetical protein